MKQGQNESNKRSIKKNWNGQQNTSRSSCEIKSRNTFKENVRNFLKKCRMQ